MPSGHSKPLIYIVDDQAVLLDLAKVSLPADTYEVETFLHPEEAFERCRKANPKPDLLITDYAMDSMTGVELIEKCLAVAPDLKTIVVSGTMGAEVISRAPGKVDQFLAKPYQPESLALLVQGLLEA